MKTSQGFTGQPVRSRVGWNTPNGVALDRSELVSSDLSRLEAEVHAGEMGALRYARIACRGSALDRIPLTDRIDVPSGYTLILQTEGQGALSQYGQTAELGAGDLALCDNGAPHRHRIEARSALLMVRLPAKSMRFHLPSPEQFCGRRLPADQGMAAVVAALVRNVCAEDPHALPPQAQECLSRQLLETVSMAFSLAFGQHTSSSVVGGRYARAKLFIEQNLGDPELGPDSISRALRISSRYLRMIFAREGECISSYVLRRRLEETARQLADPRWRSRSICEIAFHWGFNSAPHFSRSFRGHFGMSPREYRAAQQAASAEGVPTPLTGTG